MESTDQTATIEKNMGQLVGTLAGLFWHFQKDFRSRGATDEEAERWAALMTSVIYRELRDRIDGQKPPDLSAILRNALPQGKAS